MHLLTNFVLYLYALSLLFSFADLFQHNSYARKIGTGLLGVVWLSQATFFFIRIGSDDYLPVITKYETTYFFSWMIVTLAIVLFMLFKEELFLHTLSAIGFMVLLFSLSGSSAINPSLEMFTSAGGVWPLHIALSILAYVLFTVSVVFALSYLYLHRKLKQRRWFTFLNRLPSLEWIQQMSFRFTLIGWASLTVALLLGCGWLIATGRIHLLNDIKVYGSILVFVGYGIYVWRGVRATSAATKLAFWNVIVFLLVVLNMTAMNVLSGFHKWS
jgi:HemX protein